MKIGPHVIGVCSWSLRQPTASELAKACAELGISHVQLALGPLLQMTPEQRQAELDTLRGAGIELTAGMIGFGGEDYSSISNIRTTGGVLPDRDWPDRRETAFRAAELAQELGLTLLSTHIGFIPPSDDGKYRMVLDRVLEIACKFEQHGLILVMETGQERAAELLQFLNDLPAKNIAANFDPANMLLYGAGDPVEAIQTLGRHIRHVHVKDAVMSDQPGLKWGKEVPFGTGQVNPASFLHALASVGYTGPLVIEREAGPTRVADVRTAIDALRAAGTAGT